MVYGDFVAPVRSAIFFSVLKVFPYLKVSKAPSSTVIFVSKISWIHPQASDESFSLQALGQANMTSIVAQLWPSGMLG